MAKQVKAVINSRIDKLKSLGYESVPESQGDYHTIREAERMTISRKVIEYETPEEWEATLSRAETDHDKHIPLTESENISSEEVPITAIVPTMDSVKDVKAIRDNPLVKTIASFEKEYKGLTFTGIDDKAGIEKIKLAKKIVQKTRIWINKAEDALKAPYIKGSKDIKAVADEFRAMISPVEDPLDSEIERFKKLQTEEEDRKKKEEEAEANRRIDLLKESGMTFDGQFYVIGETISVDYSTIKAMPVADFDTFHGKVKKEKQRLDTVEEERLKEQRAQRLEVRSGMLKALGYEYHIDHDGIFAVPRINTFQSVKKAKLIDYEDGEFMKLFNEISNEIAKAKEAAIEELNRKSKERTVSLRSKLITAIGMQYVDSIPGPGGKGFYFKNDFIEIRTPMIMVETSTDEEFDKVIEVNEKAINEAKEAQLKKEIEYADKQRLSQDRSQQLVALGMTRAPQLSCFIFNLPNSKTDCSVAYGELTTQTPEQWEETIFTVTSAISKIKEEQTLYEAAKKKEDEDAANRKKQAEEQFQERQYRLVNLGMAIVGNAFIVKNEFGDTATIDIEEVKALDEDVWPRRLNEVSLAVDTVKALTEEKRAAKLAEMEVLKPEVQRATEYVNQVIFAVEKLAEYNLKNPALIEGLTKFKVDMLHNSQEAHIFIDSLNTKK